MTDDERNYFNTKLDDIYNEIKLVRQEMFNKLRVSMITRWSNSMQVDEILQIEHIYETPDGVIIRTR